MGKWAKRKALVATRTVAIAAAVAGPIVIFNWLSSGATARAAAWACVLLGLFALFVLAGYAIRGMPLGVLIDERNRYSLSRLQMSVWTMLVLTTTYVTFAWNLFLPGGWLEALDVKLDANLVVLMGFSVASFVAAPIALSRKAEQPGDDASLAKSAQQLTQMQGLTALPNASGRLLVKRTPTDARLADLIRGEDVANATTVDLPRLQMLLITGVVALVYASAAVKCMLDGSARIPELPRLSDSLILLVLVSHGGYLAGKLIPTNAGGGPSPETTARAVSASQRAGALVADIQSQAAAVNPSDARYGSLQTSLSLAQSVAADASALSVQTSAANLTNERVAAIEGRLSALQATARSQPSGPALQEAVDAPAREMLTKLQQGLAARGFVVAVTGVSDLATEQAIAKVLASAGLERANLHPKAYRYYEEVAQLL